MKINKTFSRLRVGIFSQARFVLIALGRGMHMEIIESPALQGIRMLMALAIIPAETEQLIRLRRPVGKNN